MTNKTEIKLFETRQVRTAWNEEEEQWYFSIVDVCGILTDQPDTEHARNYWKVLKHRLSKEGNETVTNCNQLKMVAQDGRMRLTDCLKTSDVLRLIQSVPSKKAEPFKMWLAKVGSERLDEIADPEKAIERGASYYKAKGYSENGSDFTGMKSDDIRNLCNAADAVNTEIKARYEIVAEMQPEQDYKVVRMRR